MNDTPSENAKRPRFRGWIPPTLTIAAVSLVLLEIVLRLLGLTQPVLYEADAATGFRLKPNQTARYLGNRITINQWGVRDPRPLEDKPDGTQRILVLGDSVTWGGIRIRQEDLFTSVMERELAGSQVVNAGVNGYSVARMAALYQAHLTGLEPDSIVVYAIAADFLRPARLELTGDSVAFPTQRPRLALTAALRLARLLAYNRLGWNWLEPPPAAVVPGDAPGDAHELRAGHLESNMEALTNFATSLGPETRFLVVLAPTLAGDDAEPVWRKVTQSLDAHGIEWLRLDELIKPGPALFVDGVHLTAEGHGRVGKALASVVAKM